MKCLWLLILLFADVFMISTVSHIMYVCMLEYWNRSRHSSLNVTCSKDTWSESDGEGEEMWSEEINLCQRDVTHL